MGKCGYLGQHGSDRALAKAERARQNQEAIEAANATAKTAGNKTLETRNALAAGRNVPDPEKAARAQAKMVAAEEKKVLAKAKRAAVQAKRAAAQAKKAAVAEGKTVPAESDEVEGVEEAESDEVEGVEEADKLLSAMFIDS